MEDVKQVIVVRKDLQMRKGKMAAQVAHAAMMFLLDADEAERPGELHVKLDPAEVLWLTTGYKKVVVGVDSEESLQNIVFKAKMAGIEAHIVTDMGLTEFHGEPTVTCAALGPCEANVIDSITGDLKLM